MTSIISKLEENLPVYEFLLFKNRRIPFKTSFFLLAVLTIDTINLINYTGDCLEVDRRQPYRSRIGYWTKQKTNRTYLLK